MRHIYLPHLVIPLARGIQDHIHRARTIHTHSIIHQRLALLQLILQVEHPVIQHTVDLATIQIMPVCTRRSMVRHLQRIPTCIEDTLLPLRIPLITIRPSRILHHLMAIIRSCRIQIRICLASLNHPLSREATRLRIILG